MRDPKPYGGMITYHDLEKTSTDKMWTDLMTHLPRLDISRKRAAKTPNPRFRSADNYELTKRTTKWLVNDTLRKGGKHHCAAKLANQIALRNCAKYK